MKPSRTAGQRAPLKDVFTSGVLQESPTSVGRVLAVLRTFATLERIVGVAFSASFSNRSNSSAAVVAFSQKELIEQRRLHKQHANPPDMPGRLVRQDRLDVRNRHV